MTAARKPKDTGQGVSWDALVGDEATEITRKWTAASEEERLGARMVLDDLALIVGSVQRASERIEGATPQVVADAIVLRLGERLMVWAKVATEGTP